MVACGIYKNYDDVLNKTELLKYRKLCMKSCI